jgi:hypothetical protein
MTVKELIEKLQEFPQDAVVIQRMMSEYEELESDGLRLQEPTQTKWPKIVKRNGNYMQVYGDWLGNENPEIPLLVIFPGN